MWPFLTIKNNKIDKECQTDDKQRQEEDEKAILNPIKMPDGRQIVLNGIGFGRGGAFKLSGSKETKVAGVGGGKRKTKITVLVGLGGEDRQRQG